jgi:hypothetical protein
VGEIPDPFSPESETKPKPKKGYHIYYGAVGIEFRIEIDDRGSIVQTSRNRMDLADKRSRPSPYKPHVQFSIERSIGHLVACSKKGNEERKADEVCSTKPKTIFQIRIENQTRSLLFP